MDIYKLAPRQENYMFFSYMVNKAFIKWLPPVVYELKRVNKWKAIGIYWKWCL
jgi:hypothetical protein